MQLPPRHQLTDSLVGEIEQEERGRAPARGGA